MTHSELIGPALRLVRARGFNPAPLVRRFKLPATVENDPSVVVPLQTLRDVLEACRLLIGDELLGLSVLSQWRRGAFGILGYISETAATVGDSLRAAATYQALRSEVVSVSVTVSGTRAIFTHWVEGEPTATGRDANLFGLSVFLRMVQGLAGRPLGISRAWLAHPGSRSEARLVAKALGVPRVELGQETNGLEFDAAVLAIPLATADPGLHAVLRAYGDQLLRARGHESRFRGHVRQVVRDELREQLPTLASVAHRLRTSARWLQRRLAEEETTFSALLDSVREELARAMLEDRGVPLGDVSFELKYADPSAFVRAFRRWTGVAPSTYRERRAGSGGTQ